MSRSVTALLLYVGFLIGLNFPLGKLAAAAHVPPALWSLIISTGASAALVPGLVRRGVLIWPRGGMLRYGLIAGGITFFGANLLTFSTIPYVGAGQVGMMYALSPVVTLAFSLLAGLRAPNALGLAGIGFGMSGAMLVALGRGGFGDISLWALAALGIPVLLALGNVYRTLYWPKGADPVVLAFWSHVAAALGFVALLFGQGPVSFSPLFDIPATTLAQMAVAAATFPAFFRLQRLGGPVVLSQIGYVAAATGMTAAVLLLGERYGAVTWAGAGLIAVGIGFTIAGQRSRPATQGLETAPSRAKSEP